MLPYSRLNATNSSKRFSLMDIYRMTMSNMKATASEESEEEEAWKRISPEGNIYRFNALEAEHLKHEEDLQAQFDELVHQFQHLLQADPLDCESLQPQSKDRPYRLLLHHLRHTIVKDVQADVEKEGPSRGLTPLSEFLLTNGTSRFCCGWLLLPSAQRARRGAIKNRTVAILIFFIQVSSPLLLLLNSLIGEGFRAKYLRTFSHRFGTLSALANEFTCFGSPHDTIITVLGAVFLMLFIEIARAYSSTEFQNAAKMMLLPVDGFWTKLGQIANMWCIFWSVLAMPILFLDEGNAKDIIYDSLGMLFVFSLDDIGGDALDYLAVDNDTFQKVSCWSVGMLAQCPRKISDIVDPGAQSLAEVFRISMGLEEPGLVAFAGPHAGKRCPTRLMECLEPTETTPLRAPLATRARRSGVRFSLASVPSNVTSASAKEDVYGELMLPYTAPAFEYCVHHADPATGEPAVVKVDGQHSYMVEAWRFMAAFLLVAEVAFPILFLGAYTDCSKK